MYLYCYIYVFVLLYMFCSVYSVLLCCCVYGLCVNVYCTTSTGCQLNCSYQIHHICVLYFIRVRGSCISLWLRKANYSISANTRSEVTSMNFAVFYGCNCVYRFSRFKGSVRWPCCYKTCFGSVWDCGGKYVLIYNLRLNCRLLVSLFICALSF